MNSESKEDLNVAELESFFKAIEANKSEEVRNYLLKDKNLTTSKLKPLSGYDNSMELDAYKFLGAYVGSVTGLQFAILKGYESIAKDIIDSTFEGDLNVPYGGGNTALHLATFLGSEDIVKYLLERGADPNIKNKKGFKPVDVTQSANVINLFSS